MMKNTAYQQNLCPVWSRVKSKSEGKMYGILLESVQFYVSQDVGDDIWKKILEHAGMKNNVFTTHNTYKDELMISLAKSCCHVTKTKDYNQWMTFFGTCFVEFCSSYGYDNLLRVSGRNYRDFLHGIDNIHENIRFSYPRICSPSFLVVSEDKEGCVLLYQSKRQGFKYYVIGQLKQCAIKFYNVSVNITIMEELVVDNKCHVKFRLDFDNSVYTPKMQKEKISGIQTFSSISGDTFLKVFPFCIIFNNQMLIKNVGLSMAALLKGDNVIGYNLREKFRIHRPLIPCSWTKILQFQRVIFELEYIQMTAIDELDSDSGLDVYSNVHVKKEKKSLGERMLLRGQMKYLEQWGMVVYLCKPLVSNLNDLQKMGLCINDLNMFDMSRDMVMAGWQHSSKLEQSIEQQRDNSELISNNLNKTELWKQRSDSLLYSMIPQSIAERLKSGETPIDTCELFDNVTIMFNYMVGFADICMSASPLEIVKCINSVFSLFDKIVDNYDVFKVETLGDAVYMVAGGVPDRNPNHAVNVAGLALELQSKAKCLIDPIGKELYTRIGMHTGSVVGGVVGRRMPQYCLFGDTVNTAARMQTYSMPGRIHLSEPCNEQLKGSSFVTVVRGTVNIKGKGDMRTYWLAGKAGEERTKQFCDEIRQERNLLVNHSSYDNALDLHGMHNSTSYSQMSPDFGNIKRQPSGHALSKYVAEDVNVNKMDHLSVISPCTLSSIESCSDTDSVNSLATSSHATNVTGSSVVGTKGVSIQQLVNNNATSEIKQEVNIITETEIFPRNDENSNDTVTDLNNRTNVVITEQMQTCKDELTIRESDDDDCCLKSCPFSNLFKGSGLKQPFENVPTINFGVERTQITRKPGIDHRPIKYHVIVDKSADPINGSNLSHEEPIRSCTKTKGGAKAKVEPISDGQVMSVFGSHEYLCISDSNTPNIKNSTHPDEAPEVCSKMDAKYHEEQSRDLLNTSPYIEYHSSTCDRQIKSVARDVSKSFTEDNCSERNKNDTNYCILSSKCRRGSVKCINCNNHVPSSNSLLKEKGYKLKDGILNNGSLNSIEKMSSDTIDPFLNGHNSELTNENEGCNERKNSVELPESRAGLERKGVIFQLFPSD